MLVYFSTDFMVCRIGLQSKSCSNGFYYWSDSSDPVALSYIVDNKNVLRAQSAVFGHGASSIVK